MTVEFTEDCKGLSFLSTGLAKETEDLIKGSVVDMPMYLVIKLGRISVVDLQLPYIFGTEFKHLLQGDPLLINIRVKNKYFFRVALMLSKHLEDRQLLTNHAAAFLARMCELMKLA